MWKAMIAFALAALCLPAGAARAGVCSLTVSPLTVELQIEPGHAQSGSIDITNSGNTPQNIRVFCQDWTLKPDGVVIFTAAGRLPASASGWTEVAPTQLYLLPGETQTVHYTICLPASAAGEVRTAVIFEAETQQISTPGGVALLVPRVGTILYAFCGPASLGQLKITEFQPAPAGGTVTVENAGPAHVRFTGRVDVNSDSELVRTRELGGFVVLPPPFNSRRIALPPDLFAGLAPGSYQVTLLLDSGESALRGARTTITIPTSAPLILVSK